MAKKIVLVLGVVLTLVGILGFFMNPLLGFQVNALHNIVHLATGLLGIIFGLQSESASIMYSRVFGVVYALVALLGFFTSILTKLLVLNTADNWLHLVLAIVFLYVGFAMRAASNGGSGSMQTM